MVVGFFAAIGLGMAVTQYIHSQKTQPIVVGVAAPVQTFHGNDFERRDSLPKPKAKKRMPGRPSERKGKKFGTIQVAITFAK